MEPADPCAFHGGRKAASDGFDFWQFWHLAYPTVYR
jgi:hypothetical protein